jgi:hypothetical protein
VRGDARDVAVDLYHADVRLTKESVDHGNRGRDACAERTDEQLDDGDRTDHAGEFAMLHRVEHRVAGCGERRGRPPLEPVDDRSRVGDERVGARCPESV